MVLDAYQTRYGEPLPVDAWSTHGFILREYDGWGAGLPPGLHSYQAEAMRYEIADHGDIAIFKQQIINLRQWMADRGYRDTPLIVSEYGILFPDVLGFDDDHVQQYMRDSFDFFLTTTNTQTGYPADGNRLVQSWSWFSLNYYPFDPETWQGFNGSLFDHDTGVINPLGVTFATYAAGQVNAVDLTLTNVQVNPATLSSSRAPTLTVQSTLANRGRGSVDNVALRYWLGDPLTGGSLIHTQPVAGGALAGCATVSTTFEWPLTGVDAGPYMLLVELITQDGRAESTPADNTVQHTFTVSESFLPTPSAMPMPSATPITATPTTMPLTTATNTPAPTPISSPQTPTPGTPVAGTPTPAAVPTIPLLLLEKSASKPQLALGEQPLVYTLRYTNFSTEIARNIIIEETVPVYTTFNANTSTVGWDCDNDGRPGAACRFMLGTIPARGSGGESAQIRFAVLVDEALPKNITAIANTATIGEIDSSRGKNSSTATVAIIHPSTQHRLFLPIIHE